MDIDMIYIKSYNQERYIANLPWAIALKKRKSGLPSSIETATESVCNNRSSYQLTSIDPVGRSPTEVEAWNKVLVHSEEQARIRAALMHLALVSALAALPAPLRCCERYPLPALSTALRGLHTDEIEREWIYDTGAARCFIGWEHLTSDEKSRTFQVTPQIFITAAGPVSASTAVMCNVPYLGKRQCFVLPDCPPALSVQRDVMDHGVFFS